MNIYNQPLNLCSKDPLTGYDRTGYCTTNKYDEGTHVVCAIVTLDFLRYTYSKGNDLITKRKGFPGLKPGDKWCLCALRWLESYKAGYAPLIDLKATNKKALDFINLKLLSSYEMK